MTDIDTQHLGLNSLGFAGPPADTRVVVAMSGGVDSSAVAALLKDEGYDVIGITLQLYDHGVAIEKVGACCAGQDILDARRVAERLDFPHYVLDYENQFREDVMEEFADSYLRGETPIPCIRCNERVKFRDLLKTAKDLGADCLATGHYIQRVVGEGGVEMRRGIDPVRDQSYFLFSTTREQLDFLRFPLGGLKKDVTRALAADHGLTVADKPDSQDICFVPEGRYTSVIERLRPGAAEPGDIVHLDGRVLGEHEGIMHYTIGQRRGLRVAVGDPLYVVALKADTNQVIVGPREALLTRTLTLRETNWLGNGLETDLPEEGLACFAKVRSTRPPMAARAFIADGTLKVELTEGDYGVSPGQACVLYDGETADARVLGGGWIAKAENPALVA